ncbi:hypothetical protein BOTBODRAFT_176059 [Botryobasidium botryosum FD-172 SS1]|uniref:Uncharacterized protein n=1 Tax=Botryobasidium botryosum (strain FD-172 SS1) TaxID=930990 RepID=A0A067MAZ2_BOTB1|nr:hypothetical protein BOTBODRAFT_176059 [Botryobasidium botryosum FD-172 SS1]
MAAPRSCATPTTTSAIPLPPQPTQFPPYPNPTPFSSQPMQFLPSSAHQHWAFPTQPYTFAVPWNYAPTFPYSHIPFTAAPNSRVYQPPPVPQQQVLDNPRLPESGNLTLESQRQRPKGTKVKRVLNPRRTQRPVVLAPSQHVHLHQVARKLLRVEHTDP